MGKSKTDEPRLSKSLEELVEYFDTHDLGDEWDEMPEVHFDVQIKRRIHLIEIDEELAHELTQIAKSKRTSSEALVNDWLKERIAHRRNTR